MQNHLVFKQPIRYLLHLNGYQLNNNNFLYNTVTNTNNNLLKTCFFVLNINYHVMHHTKCIKLKLHYNSFDYVSLIFFL